MPLLEIKNLHLEFGTAEDAFRAVDGVSLHIESGETLCLVGESGCGKSVTAQSIARLVPTPPAKYVGGEILLNGRDVLQMDKNELRSIRGGVVSYVFQEPGASLNPVFRVGNQIKESLKLHKPEKATDAEVIRLLKLVGIPAPESRIRNYPFEMSGGMQQRVMIAMALASEPKLLVADEPTTALDVTIQAQILDLLRDLKQQLGMAILLITHNLGIVGDMADRVAVMYAGQIVELAPARELLRRPLHPYTRALMASVPKLSGGAERLTAIPGNVPRIGNFPPGCRFAPRCLIAKPECSDAIPELVEVEPQRWVRCPFWETNDYTSRGMKYQLVLQLSGESVNDFDALVKLEDSIAALLQQQAEVEGHDFGSGEANIFILTGKPAAVVERLLPLLETTNKPRLSIAAYRDLDGEDFTVLWPVGSRPGFQTA